MNIREIEALDENAAKAMAKEAVEVKGHTMYLVDLGKYFGYSALVFADGRHIYHANDYALHHGDKKDDVEYLRDWYMESMKGKLFIYNCEDATIEKIDLTHRHDCAICGQKSDFEDETFDFDEEEA